MILDEHLVESLLKAAGIEPDARDVLDSMESWLGFNDDVYEGLTVEDCLPLDKSVYEMALLLFQKAWNSEDSINTSSSTLNYPTRNPFVDTDIPPESITLDAVFPSIKATRWIYGWMELNLSPPGTSTVESSATLSSSRDNKGSLIRHLLEHDTTDHTFVRSFYQHIQDLPTLQSQFHRYTQSLRQGSSTTSQQNAPGRGLANPQARLRQYEFAQQTAARFETEWQTHMDRLEVVMGAVYWTGDVPVRRICRRLLGRVWQDFIQQSNTAGSASLRQENTRAAGIRITLRLLYRIIQGIQNDATNGGSLPDVYQQLMLQHLVPLHEPNAMVLWRDQTSVLELYHEPLTQCVGVLLQKQPSWMAQLFPALIAIFPKVGNTPKQVLMLHELDTYVGLLEKIGDGAIETEWMKWWPNFLQIVSRCMSSDHSRVAERALSFFKNKSFEELVMKSYKSSLPILLQALVKREPPWNPTVRKQSFHILDDLYKKDEKAFATVCNQVYGGGTGEIQQSGLSKTPPEIAADDPQIIPSRVSDFSLRAGMGSWKPPTSKTTLPGQRTSLSSGMSHPTLTVTGVAPWAVSSQSSKQLSDKNRSDPPLTVTGVAPWAVKPSGNAPVSQKRRIEGMEAVHETPAEKEESQPKTGADYVLAYMNKIKPAEEDTGYSSWSKSQLAETPTLLPDLKFHDLVFGHIIGTGAFSTVKYARMIDRSKTRSHWPEYAVKVRTKMIFYPIYRCRYNLTLMPPLSSQIISTAKIRELCYEKSVQREIAVLRIVSHPGVARLISSFRFHDGAYLVLEYASRGDLHTLLQKHGSLDESSTRFVIGEVAATLSSLHSTGLVYGDLKPENIVITEPGHVKLTDFGGCRPFTDEAKEAIASIAQNLLQNLRSGDWKPQRDADIGGKERKVKNDSDQNEWDEKSSDDQEDTRIEGTTAYLPPEVVMGAIPTPSADAWALGCVLYQCLSGRPPLLENDDESTRRRIVSFSADESPGEGLDKIFEDPHASGIGMSARAMIKALLNNVAGERPSMQEVAIMDFFACNNVDIFSLYQRPAHPLDAGQVMPVPDSRWSRRQLSSIWSPQPEAYSMEVSVTTVVNTERSGELSNKAPIPEGDERTGSFTPIRSMAGSSLPTLR